MSITWKIHIKLTRPSFPLPENEATKRNDFFIVYRESKVASPVHWDEEGQGDSGASVR